MFRDVLRVLLLNINHLTLEVYMLLGLLLSNILYIYNFC